MNPNQQCARSLDCKLVKLSVSILVLSLSSVLLSCRVQPRPATPVIAPTMTTSPTPSPIAWSTPVDTPAPTPMVLAGTPIPSSLAVISPANADRLVQLARWGKGTIKTVAWSPNRQLLAIAPSFGIYLYDAQTLALVRFMETGARMADLGLFPGWNRVGLAGKMMLCGYGE